MATREYFIDAQAVAEKAAQTLVTDLCNAIDKHGNATWVAAGGSTPARAYDIIAERYLREVPWDHVRVLMGDERCVEPTSPDSNWRQLDDQLLSKVSIPKENLLRPLGELGPETAAARYKAALEKLEITDSGAPRLDHVWLGMGEDGHTLSLFPGRAELETDELVIPIHESPKPPPDRVTLALPCLRGVNTCLILVTGAGKREAAAAAAAGDRSLPVVRAADTVDKSGGRAAWLFDEAAAQDIARATT